MDVGLKGSICALRIPAECLEVNTVFNHVLDFPVSDFNVTFIVVTEIRLKLREVTDCIPTAVVAVSPE
jgi:hypothetical protein